ncbi:MAG: hypothetical protein QG597_3484 [Actinomycetota bacterium]|nr:hypothetical protein [Actinomycetota bacterium]
MVLRPEPLRAGQRPAPEKLAAPDPHGVWTRRWRIANRSGKLPAAWAPVSWSSPSDRRLRLHDWSPRLSTFHFPRERLPRRAMATDPSRRHGRLRHGRSPGLRLRRWHRLGSGDKWPRVLDDVSRRRAASPGRCPPRMRDTVAVKRTAGCRRDGGGQDTRDEHVGNADRSWRAVQVAPKRPFHRSPADAGASAELDADAGPVSGGSQGDVAVAGVVGVSGADE